MPRPIERGAQPPHDQPAHQAGIAEAHLCLGGVDVHIDLARRNLQEQRHHRMPVARQHVLIGAPHRADEQAVFHWPSVDEQELMIGNAPVECRQPRDAAQHHAFAAIIQRNTIFRQRAVGQRRHPFGARLPRRHGQRAAAVMLQREAHVRPRHRQAFHHIDAGGIFGAGGAEELAPGGHLREQPFHADARAGREGGGAFVDQLAIVDHPPPAVAPPHPAFDREGRHAGDRRQRLAAKAQRRHRLDGVVRQLGRGMAFEREGDLVARHAAAVVGHLDPRGPALRQCDGDARGACVDRVLDKLLQRAGGSFHHFARGYAIHQMFGQTAY
jgi:hypothetical protein